MLRHKEPYLSFYRILGYCPHRIELYQQAVTHRSAVASDENGRKINNERLEFLGDAVFTLVTADILYHAFPEKREGFLSSSRSRIIQRETLNRIALEIGLNKLVRADIQITSAMNLRHCLNPIRKIPLRKKKKTRTAENNSLPFLIYQTSTVIKHQERFISHIEKKVDNRKPGRKAPFHRKDLIIRPGQ